MSNRPNWFAPLWNVLWRVAVLALLLFVVWRTRSIIVMTLFAGTLAYAVSFLVNGLLNFWNRSLPRFGSAHFKRITAVLLCYIVIGYGVYWTAGKFVAPIRAEIGALTKNWPQYQQKFNEWKEGAWDDWYTSTVPLTMRQAIKRYTSSSNFTDGAAGMIAPLGGIVQNSGRVIGQVVELVLVPILAFYFLVDSRRLKRDVFQFIPRNHTRFAARLCRETNHIMHSYIKSQALLCFVAGVVTWFILWVLGAFFHSGVGRYAVVLGIYAGFTRAIPVLGPLIGGIPIVALAAFSSQSVELGVTVAILFTAMHFAESKFVMPLIVGDQLNLHALWVILSLLIGAEFFGLIGMFFAAPVAAVARNIWRYYYLQHPTRTGVVIELKENIAR